MNLINVSDDVVEYTASSLNTLLNICKDFCSVEGVGGWLYRGQADIEWALQPKAGRAPYTASDNSDLAMFSIWKKKAVAYEQLPEDDLECLALAQHHGLSTRLLDWSNNPLVATYFACKEASNKDGALYLYFPRNVIPSPHPKLEEITEIKQYIPRAIAPRIQRQSGRFTYHPTPQEAISFGEIGYPFAGQRLKRVKLPAPAKKQILMELNLCGMNEEGIFPDLDGLSRHFNWLKAEESI